MVGRHLIPRLLAQRSKYRIMAMEKPGTPRADALEKLARGKATVAFWGGSLADTVMIENLVRQADVVIDLADEEAGADASKEEASDGASRVFLEAQVLLEAARRHMPERVIYLSDARVYGSAEMVPMTEEHRLSPRSPSAAGIAAADRLAYSYCARYDLPVVIFRPFSVYGPHQCLGALVPAITVGALRGDPISLEGDGSATRDWVHVEDLCQAVMSALTAQLAQLRGEAINIGTGVETSTRSLAQAILQEAERSESLLRFGPELPGEVRQLVSSTSKANFLLGWEPAVDLSSGLRRTVEWYIEHPECWQAAARAGPGDAVEGETGEDTA